MRLRLTFLIWFALVIPAFAIDLESGFDDGPINASQITPTTTNFGNNLSSTDNTVQKALDTLDDMVGGGGTECSSSSCNLNVATTLNSQDICLENGTNCPASAPAAPAGGTGAVQYNNAGTTAGAENVFSFNGTNIGIGTTDARSKFEVASGNVGIGTFGTNHAILEVTGNGAKEVLRLNDSGINDTTPLIVKSDGNVGIGTVTPRTILEVYSAGLAADNMPLLSVTNSTTAANVGIGTTATLRGLYISGNGSDGQARTMRIWNTGTAGISRIDLSNRTTTDTVTDQVVGSATANAITGAPTGSSSRVFGSGGVLPYFMGTSTANNYVLVSNNVQRLNILGADGNVGIGSVNPVQKLDVVGTAQITGFKLPTGAAAGNVLVSSSVGLGTWMTPAAIGVGSGGSAAGGLGAVQYNSPVGTFAGKENVLSMNGTNIGIGTTNGTFLLDARGTAWITSLGVGSSTYQSDNTSGLIKSKYLYSDYITLNSSTNCVVFDNSNISNSGNGLGCGSGATTSSIPLYVREGTGVSFGADRASIILQGQTYTTNTSFNQQGQIKMMPDIYNGSGVLNRPTTLRITDAPSGTSVTAASSPNALSVDAGNASFMGNVGIGTFKATGNFQLAGNGAAAGFMLQASSALGIGTWVPAPAGGGGASSQWNTLSGIGIGTSDPVGIGTSTFSQKLTVVGNVGIGTVNYGAWVNQAATSSGMTIQGNLGIGTFEAKNSLIVYGSGITGTGNVGIGSLAPGAALDVNGTLRLSNSGDSNFFGNVGIGTGVPMSSLAIQGAASIGSATFSGTANPDIVGLMVSGNVGIGTTRTTSGAALTVMSGNVGIGTWIPATPLSIKGGTTKAKVNGANTACNTTCGVFSCDSGYDTAVTSIFVDCADATADTCNCWK